MHATLLVFFCYDDKVDAVMARDRCGSRAFCLSGCDHSTFLRVAVATNQINQPSHHRPWIPQGRCHFFERIETRQDHQHTSALSPWQL